MSCRNAILALAMLAISPGVFAVSNGKEAPRPRILISSDIGGTDPDDFQSMIHLLMYADRFEIEGLISSPYGEGRKADFLEMINRYEQDFTKLKARSEVFSKPDVLRNICKQGAVGAAPYKGYGSPTEGSNWIIKCARKPSEQPLWVLVWGGLEDIAQALHDDPKIKEKIRVYWIGGPNKKWSINPYAYIADKHPDLWMIEANATYRGWFMDEASPEDLRNDSYYDNYIQGQGALGREFKNHYNGNIKMGDTPSLVYVMDGSPEDPLTRSWGGMFTPIERSSRFVFTRNTTLKDTVAAYATLEWKFSGPILDIPADSSCFTMEISGQIWPGYYLGKGTYAIRYSSKKPEICSYITRSSIPELDGLQGQFVSTIPWPGKGSSSDYKMGDTWFSDRQEPALFIGVQQGAKTVSMHRKDFLMDWAERWSWLR